MNPRSTAGFTLVELLVGMMILLVVVTGIHTSFSIGLRARAQARERTEKLQAIRTLVRQFEGDVRNLVPIRPAVAIREDTVDLLRYPPAHDPDRDEDDATFRIARVRYRFVEDDDGRRCIRERTSLKWHDDFDPVNALGFEERDGALVPMDDPAATDWTEERRVADLGAVRWQGLRREEGGLVESPTGPDEDISAIRLEMSPSVGDPSRSDPPDSLAYRLVIPLPPGRTP